MTPHNAKHAALNGMALARLGYVGEVLKSIVDTQCENGNWNCNPYMMGLANGLIMAQAILTGDKPQFKSAPEVWLDDLGYTGVETVPFEQEAQLIFSNM